MLGTIGGGYVLGRFGWAWGFWINVPLAAVAIVLAPLLLPASQHRTAKSLDLAGAVLATAGVSVLVYGLTQAGQGHVAAGGWWGVVGLVLLGAFVVVEHRVPEPLIPMAVLRQQTLLGATLLTLMFAEVTNTPLFFITLYLQQVKGYTPLATGLAYLPGNLAIVSGAALATPLLARLGQQRTLLGGMSLLFVAPLLLARVTVDSAYLGTILPGLVLLGLGLGVMQVATTVGGTTGVREADRGLAGGLLTTAAQLGTALGLAVLVAVAARMTNFAAAGSPADEALVAGVRWAFYTGASIAASGVLLTLTMMRRRTAVLISD